MSIDTESAGYSVDTPKARFHWEPKRHSSNTVFPPKGLTLTLNFKPPESAISKYNGLTISVHYEMYQGIPVLAKWVTVNNKIYDKVIVDSLECEILAVTEAEKRRLRVESNYAFDGMNTTHWGSDSEYLTQTDYLYQMPILLTSKYPLGPGVHLKPSEQFESFRTIEIIYDSDDRDFDCMIHVILPQKDWV